MPDAALPREGDSPVAAPSTGAPRHSRRRSPLASAAPVSRACARKALLIRVEVDVARELDRGEVDNAHRAALVGHVEAHAERVELAVVGEDLEGLLRVVGGVQELDAGVQLLAGRAQDNLQLLGRRVHREGAEGTAVHALALGSRRDLLGHGSHGLHGVVGGGTDGELVLAVVADLDHRGLVAGADEGLDRARLTVLTVRLEREGGPVGTEPELDVRVHGAALAGDGNLDTILGEIVELPGLAGHALDALLELAIGANVLNAPADTRRLGHHGSGGNAKGSRIHVDLGHLGRTHAEGSGALENGGESNEASRHLHCRSDAEHNLPGES
mmetsp:Transcript_33260/g.87508  ORF Transcript_33260/g.87508 Transcript_33260/m.87508 type:complete len:328 (+) Transcript_33260:156-1139(+)